MIWGDFQGITGVTRGGRGVKKLENWGDVIYGWSHSEMAFVLYNIGVMFTFLANRESRTGSESMKTACTYYQNAAWAFHTLPDRHPQGQL